MLQLDDFDADDLFADEPSVPAPRFELRPPREQDAVTQPVLDRLELASSSGCSSAAMLCGFGWVSVPSSSRSASGLSR